MSPTPSGKWSRYLRRSLLTVDPASRTRKSSDPFPESKSVPLSERVHLKVRVKRLEVVRRLVVETTIRDFKNELFYPERLKLRSLLNEYLFLIADPAIYERAKGMSPMARQELLTKHLSDVRGRIIRVCGKNVGLNVIQHVINLSDAGSRLLEDSALPPKKEKN